MGIDAPGQTPVPQGERHLPEPYRVTIMVSQSMGDDALEALAVRLKGRSDVRLAFRGVPAGMSVPQFAFWLSSLQGEPGEASIEAVIDPDIFEATGTTLVPTMVLEDMSAPAPSRDADTGEIVATAVGFHDPDWLHERFLAGDTAPSSRNVYEVSEEDLRERARRDAQAVMARLGADNEARVARYWSDTARKLDRAGLTPATADSIRPLAFIFRAEEAIRDAQGAVLAYPGEIYDARDVRPFDRRLVVFDPNRPAELDFVRQTLAREEAGVTRTVLVATALPGTAPDAQPWDGLQALVTEFEQKVFLLNPQMQRAFQIRHTPTIVRPRPEEGDVVAVETKVEG